MSVAVEQTPPSLRRRLTGFFFSKLARASAWLSAGAIAAGILAYAFQVIMGRMLSPQEYGLFSAMMALFVVFSAPLGTLLMVIARKVSEYRARDEIGSIAHFHRSINVRTAVVGAVALCVFLLFAPQIQTYLKAPSVIPVYLLGALLFLNFLPIINNAFLQGLQRFAWLSTTSIVAVLLKIILAAALVWLGYGLAGALGGVILTTAATWLITYGALRTPLSQGRGQPYKSAHLSVKSALPVLAANAAFAAMTQLDMVVVNYYFSAHDAGLYAAASVLGKAVLYLPGGIAMALFPMVAENNARDESSAHLLLQAVGLTALLCTVGAIVYYVLGEWIIAVLYGESYRGAGAILRYFGFVMLPMALVLVAEQFLIAKGRVLFAYLFVVVAPLQLAAIYFWHDSLQAVLAVLGVSGLALALLGYGLLWRAFRKAPAPGERAARNAG